MKKIMFLIAVAALLLCGCKDVVVGGNPGTNDTSSSQNTENSSSTNTADVSFAQTDADMFTDRDGRTEYNETGSVYIKFNGSSIECSSSAVKISGTTVTITDEGTYILSGTLDDGMVIVDAEETDKPQLVFDGVTINCSTSAPIYILESDKVFITLADNSENVLSSGDEFIAIDDNNIDAAVFSKQDLTFNGNGTLTVSSPAGHGIVSKDDLVFTGGTYNITSASHGLDANDSVRISDTVITVDSGKDGIHAENNDDASLGFIYISSGTFNIESEGDGISAGSYIQIVSGTFDILSGGGSVNASKQTSDGWGDYGGGGGGGMRPGGRSGTSTTATASSEESTSIKGLKAAGGMLIEGGTFNIDSADDSIHSNTSVTVNGGTFYISAGDDAFHADETLLINDGLIDISESYEGLEGLYITVNGGDIRIVSSDDGINAAGGTDSSGTGGMRPGGDMFGGGSNSKGTITINGGALYIKASGDGIDANGTLEITGGYVTVCGPTQGDTAVLDYDKTAVISGGTFVGTGSSMMAQTFSSSTQGVIALSVGNQSAGTLITVKDSSGNEIISYEPALSFAIVIISMPELNSGETYSVTVGSLSGDFKAN